MDDTKRLAYIVGEQHRLKRRLDRMQPGSRRDRLLRFIGSLEFTRLSIIAQAEGKK